MKTFFLKAMKFPNSLYHKHSVNQRSKKFSPKSLAPWLILSIQAHNYIQSKRPGTEGTGLYLAGEEADEYKWEKVRTISHQIFKYGERNYAFLCTKVPVNPVDVTSWTAFKPGGQINRQLHNSVKTQSHMLFVDKQDGLNGHFTWERLER